MKILIVIWLFLVWQKVLTLLIGGEATFGAFLVQAIYCRVRYFRDSQIIFDDEKNAIPIEAEVIN